MTLEVRPAPSGAPDSTASDASLIDDWLGLAAYLADAVAGGDESVDAARVELAAAATGILERQALVRAAAEAAARHGAESLTTALLQWATTDADRSAAAA
jgi:hypothetical protein